MKKILTCRDKKLDLNRTLIMGIVNVTPDSFSDGSKFLDPKAAVAHAIALCEAGADLIDVGGESTRPGAAEVSAEEETDRVLPVIEALVKEIDVPVSIDTYKSATAREALNAGAHLVNDISGFRFDSEMASVTAQFGAAAVLMHIKGQPRNMQQNPVYEDVVQEIKSYLAESIRIAGRHGIDDIVIDPGIGFGKTVEHNFEILRRLSEFAELGRPVLVGTSRKSFIGKVLGLTVEERLSGSIATAVAAAMNGAHILRVHDVLETKRALAMVDPIVRR